MNKQKQVIKIKKQQLKIKMYLSFVFVFEAHFDWKKISKECQLIGIISK